MQETNANRHEVERSILEGLGIDYKDQHITKLVLTLESGSPPTVEITRMLTDIYSAETIEYELKIKEKDNA